MMFTKTEIRVLELFTANILNSFTIREVSRLAKKDLKIVYTSIKNLTAKKFLIKQKRGLNLNYKNNWQDLAYIENIRKEAFFEKNPSIKMHLNRFLEKSKNKLFVLLIFGSYASGKADKKSDVDLLAVTSKDNEGFERQLNSVLSLSQEEFHVNTISIASFRELLVKRDEINIVNETFSSHIIIYGAEQYYALLGERDVR